MREWLMRRLSHKEIGWAENGETFTRFVLLHTRWFNVYLHYLDAPYASECHDHPWWFATLILKSGYLERIGDRYHRRHAGSIHYHPADFAHAITTPYGPSWSLVVVGQKSRAWGFRTCEP